MNTMAEEKEPVTIKKYANRRLYNTGTSTYVTLEDLAAMVKQGEDFIVYDAKTGEDITRSVLAQIIFEQENKEGQSLLPITFLRQLIRFYGDSMQMLVPRYLEQSIDTFTREQGKFREQMAQAFGGVGFGAMEDQVRRNMEMFEKTFAMFAPFARGQGKAEDKPQSSSGEMDDLKRQLDEQIATQNAELDAVAAASKGLYEETMGLEGDALKMMKENGLVVHEPTPADMVKWREAADRRLRLEQEDPARVGVILGTGVGGGIVVRGQILTGANAIAGEWGHNPLPLPAADDLPLPVCYCGRSGCIETYLSGPALTREHAVRCGQTLSPAEIAERADAGDPACEMTLQRYEMRLGRALAGIINILDPQVIVLGGGLSNLQRLYRNLPARCGPHVFSDVFYTRIVPPAHGDSSGVRGAAWLWD